MKHACTALLFALSPVAAYPAEDNPDVNNYFSPQPVLSAQEKAGLALSANWKSSSAKALKPTPGPDGAVSFLFGASQPGIVCAVMQVCDIELQPGEQVNSIHLGDAARWMVEPAINGRGEEQIQHLIIKPMDVGLSTSLIVTTNRRTYHMALRSTHHDFMPRITFVYPENVMKKLEAVKVVSEQEHAKKILPETGEYLDNLDFNYAMEGKASWKPLRVYNDGKKTILEMPPSMESSEAPTLLVVRKDGGLFSDDEQVMVNYRVQHNRYIVDSLFDKAILISGVGDAQDRITITKEQ
jgi:P-type conjugative transfer protein TrbG